MITRIIRMQCDVKYCNAVREVPYEEKAVVDDKGWIVINDPRAFEDRYVPATCICPKHIKLQRKPV